MEKMEAISRWMEYLFLMAAMGVVYAVATRAFLAS